MGPLNPSEASPDAPARAESARNLAIVGQVGDAYGVRGWVRVASYTVPPGNLLTYRPWFLHRAGHWRPMNPLQAKPHGEGFIASFPGIGDRDSALALKGCRLGVPAESFPPTEENEYYWRDLIGLKVIDQEGKALGVVERLIETGARDLLSVTGEPPILIPFARQFVTEVRLREGFLRVDWTEAD